MTGAPFNPFDLLDLALMYAAKSNRRHLSDEKFPGFYEDFFNELDATVLASGSDPRKILRHGGVVDGIKTFSPVGRLLDLGCGAGDNLRSLSSLRGLTLFGMDYARSTLEMARRLVGAGARLVRASGSSLPYPDASFDAVTCVEVIEHIPDDRAVIREVRRVLRPGGTFIVTVPYRHWFPAYAKLIGHLRHYTRTSLEDLLRGEGFEVVEWIQNCPRWHRAADYAYAVSRLLGVINGRIGRESSPHLATLPGMSRPLLLILLDMIEPLRRRDEALPYSMLETSTSIIARRK